MYNEISFKHDFSLSLFQLHSIVRCIEYYIVSIVWLMIGLLNRYPLSIWVSNVWDKHTLSIDRCVDILYFAT